MLPPICLVQNIDLAFRMHVFADLQPYICTFADCKLETAQFASREAWANHEFSNHRTRQSWRCTECSQRFLSSLEWVNHLQQVHQRRFSGTRLQVALDIASEQQSRSVEGEECPLCQNMCGKSRRTFTKHVGQHMEEIALITLPRSTEDSEDDSDIVSTNANSSSDISDPLKSIGKNVHDGTDDSQKSPRGGEITRHVSQIERSITPEPIEIQQEMESSKDLVENSRDNVEISKGPIDQEALEEKSTRVKSNPNASNIETPFTRNITDDGELSLVGSITQSGTITEFVKANDGQEIALRSGEAFPSAAAKDRPLGHLSDQPQLLRTLDPADSHTHRPGSALFSLDDRASQTNHTGDSFADWLFDPATEKGFMAVHDTAGGRSENRKTCASPPDHSEDRTEHEDVGRKRQITAVAPTMSKKAEPDNDRIRSNS